LSKSSTKYQTSRESNFHLLLGFFDGEMRFSLKTTRARNLVGTQEAASRLRRICLLLVGPTKQVPLGLRVNPRRILINTTSSESEMITFLSDAMKRMEANFDKQIETLQQQNQAMQNKIVLLERQGQQNIISTKRWWLG
jgi:hypothetical protein